MQATVIDQRGVTGLEVAIVLIAFVVVSSVFAYSALSAGLASSDKAEATISASLSKASGSLELRGGVKLETTLTTKALTTVTAEAVGTGDGDDTTFSMASTLVLSNSETGIRRRCGKGPRDGAWSTSMMVTGVWERAAFGTLMVLLSRIPTSQEATRSE